ncbi:MAG: carboxypeptidase regulatory-like domain-containing protein [Planctomycetes bacterium]|nr:carboxypeptidase regulatory-like domain-containing protein [Planctomycetota bacterium]MCW8136551.1 carboxypeptidase regulatory-like domain-containing protein [Planctomycetota bacterium]
MSQRTLLISLGACAALLLLAAGVFFVGPEVGLFGPTGSRNDALGRSNTPGPDGPGYIGVDQHGEYEVDADGKRVYRDAQGRYEIGPDGKRIYRDQQGRRYIIGPDGKRIYLDEAIKGNQGAPAVRSGPEGSTAGPGPGSRGESDPDAEEEKPKPASLSGHVQDDNGNPFPGASVMAGDKWARSDDEGNFQFSELPSQVPLTVLASDGKGNASKPVNTKLAPGHTRLPSPLVLPRDTSIRGYVRTPDNAPVSGATVLLQTASGHAITVNGSQTTQGDGYFEFKNLLPVAYRVQVTRDGYTPRILNNVIPPMQLEVELTPGAAISGTVRAQGGEPVANARIACDFHAEPAQHFHTEAFTDEAGFYAVKCQPESQHNTITVVAAGFVSQNRTLVKSAASGVDFTLKPSGNVVLRGRLLAKDGLPITQATFKAADNTGKNVKVTQSVGPNAEGYFWCEVEPAGTRLVVSAPGKANVTADYAPQPGGEVDLGVLYMDGGYAVYGVIREAGDNGVPIKGADVSVGPNKVTTGQDGKYRIEGVGTETFIIRVLHPAYLGSAVNVTPVSGQYEIERDIELSKAAFEARVLVKLADGTPLAGVKGTLTAYGQTKTSGQDGLLHFTGLSAMTIDAVFEKPGYAKISTKIKADVGDKVASAPPQEVIMTPGAVLSGVCTSSTSSIPAASNVEVWDTSKLVVTLQTDTQGRYQTDALPLGTYYVALPDYGYAPRMVELTEEGAELNLEIGPLSHIRGRMLRSNGQPHANAGVYIYRRDNVYWGATIHTGPDGRYEVSNLWPGEWVFCALKSQGDTAAQFAVHVSVTKAGWNDINIDLPQITGVMRGRVTYPGGAPVKRARVAVTNLSAQFERALLAAYVVTDDDGWYTAERLENGATMIARVGGYADDADTGTAFSEQVVIPSDDTPVEAHIEVAPGGVAFRVNWRRADGGPVISGGPLAYLFDLQGRMSGLYFGGGRYTGHVDLRDVVPGEYTLVVTHRGCKRAILQFTVGSAAPTGLEVLIEVENRTGNE